MGGRLARESSIWNMLIFGTPRYEIGGLVKQEAETLKSEPLNDGKTLSDYNDIDEEEGLLEEKNGFDLELNMERSKKRRNVMKYIFTFGLMIFSISYLMKVIIGDWCCMMKSPIESQPYLNKYLDESFLNENIAEEKRTEIISVADPFIPNPKYGSSVYSTLLVNHTFGSSWGKPAVVNFTPPDINFDKVVLTLNTSVSGVQYDRLANLFIDGVQIWRTSTIEPGRRSVFSSTKKDVSVFLKLFQKQNSKIIFQLDNLLTGTLTGQFDIQLKADFYKSSEPVHAFEEDTESIHEIFVTSKPADQIFPLVDHSEQNKSSLVYLPSDRLAYQIPKLPQNTTRLKLSISTSGNAAEEFWYANVLDKYKHYFRRPIDGHGPLRVVNVYFNGEKIATQAPQPIIFSGGLSPALWSAVVSTNAFDLPNIELDITGLLPFVWESQSIEDRVLEIDVSNVLDETSSLKSSISENWITSANLLTFESEKVKSSGGEVLTVNDRRKSNKIDFASDGMLNQILTSKFDAVFDSSLNFELVDGSELNTLVESYTRATLTNVQKIEDVNMSLDLVHTGSSEKEFKITDSDDESVIFKYSTKLDYPLVLSKKEKNVTRGPDFYEIEYDLNLVNVRSSKVRINDRSLIENSSAQNGSSNYFISKLGNHGNAKLDTKYKMVVDSPNKSYNYKRLVKSDNGVIISDESCTSDKKTASEDFDFNDLSILLNNIIDESCKA